MKFLVVVALLATSQVTMAQFNTQQKKISQEQRVTVKKPNAFLNAVKIPSILIGMGVYACASDKVINRYEIREERNEHLPNFHTTIDNYLMHAPIVAVYGLNMAGIKGKHDFKNRTLLLVKSEAIMFALRILLNHSPRLLVRMVPTRNLLFLAIPRRHLPQQPSWLRNMGGKVSGMQSVPMAWRQQLEPCEF